jgi:2-polyprenyl-3-methyl-5-hydroxy-6-metoxy-1,4-benzoquinol methylase
VNPSAGESVPCEQAQEQLQTLTQSGYHLSMRPNAQHNGLATLSAKEWSALPQQVVEEFLARIKNPRVLDAGCGDCCRIPFPPHAFVVGLDDSPEALERNNQVHQKNLGDIQNYPLEPNSYDLITCIDVLEHLPYPQKALQNLWQALKPGGLMILRAPNPYSLKGIITKWTPHWVHVAFRRYVLGNRNAGKPGYPPFKTYLRNSIVPAAIARWVIQQGGTVRGLYFREGSNPYDLKRYSKVLWGAWNTLLFLMRVLSLGRYSERTDYIIVVEKNSA